MVTAGLIAAVLVLAELLRRTRATAARAQTNAATARVEVARLERAFAGTLRRMADVGTYPADATSYMPRVDAQQAGR